MSPQVHQQTVGDRLTPLGFRLVQPNAQGVLAARNLTGATVKIYAVDQSGAVVIDAACVVTDAAGGEGQYNWAAGDVTQNRDLWAWITVEQGGLVDSFPAGGRMFKIDFSRRG